MAKILLIDDDADILAVLRANFETHGHRVVSTLDPRSAVHLAQHTPADAVVLDLMMPGITGWDVLDLLRKNAETQNVPVVILSACADVSERVRGLRSGADDFVVKPFNPEELVARVEGLISRRTATVSAALQGRLEENPCREVIQNLEQHAKTGTLEVQTKDGTGRIVFLSGRLHSASFLGYEGKEAVLTLLEQQQGLFRFLSDGPEASETNGRDLPSFQSILMLAVWVEDELSSRRRHLPEAETVLAEGGPLPELPPDFEELPVWNVLEKARELWEPSLRKLLHSKLASPNKVRLAVAWLKEQGVLTASQQSPEIVESTESDGETHEELHEEIDFALRELFQAALFRGLSLDALEVGFLVQDGAWPAFLAFMESVPNALIEGEGGRIKRRLQLVRNASIKLNHDSGSLVLRVMTPVQTEGSAEMIRKANVGVVLWTSRQGTEADQLAKVIESAAASSTGLLRVGDADRVGSRWRLVSGSEMAPQNLFLELCRAELV